MADHESDRDRFADGGSPGMNEAYDRINGKARRIAYELRRRAVTPDTRQSIEWIGLEYDGEMYAGGPSMRQVADNGWLVGISDVIDPQSRSGERSRTVLVLAPTGDLLACISEPSDVSPLLGFPYICLVTRDALERAQEGADPGLMGDPEQIAYDLDRLAERYGLTLSDDPAGS